MGNETHAHTCRLTWKRDWKSRFLSERVAGYDDMKLEVGHPRSLMRIGRSRQTNNTYRTTCFPLQLFPWRRKCHWKRLEIQIKTLISISPTKNGRSSRLEVFDVSEFLETVKSRCWMVVVHHRHPAFHSNPITAIHLNGTIQNLHVPYHITNRKVGKNVKEELFPVFFLLLCCFSSGFHQGRRRKIIIMRRP